MPVVVLVGFMGSGKSTVGRCLAERMGLPFVDLDDEIERLEGATIPEIFQDAGEPGFRAAETRALRAQLGRGSAVLATGGGLFADAGNRNLIARAGGCSVFIDVPWPAVVERIGSDDASRPLWRDRDEARRLYDERLPTYRLADVVLHLHGDETPATVAERALRELSEVGCGT